jgi:protein involved in polysaccharide export with SLBB domain
MEQTNSHGRRSRRIAAQLASAVILAVLWVAPAGATIHSGDKLQIRVYNYPDLSVQTTVDARGRIELPLAGSVDVQGLETDQIAGRIQRALLPYVRKPAVEVQALDASPSIFVSGGPGGVFKYQPGETLAGALADIQKAELQKTNGVDLYNSRVDLRNVSVQRDGHVIGTYDAVALSGRGEPRATLLPGDTLVFVNKPIAVRVQGEVKQPGMTYLAADQTISDAVAQAGGLLPTAATAPLVLERGGERRALAVGDPTVQSPAQNGDVITIPVAPRVTVAGLVAKPGLVALQNNPSLLSALYNAGGPDKYANLRSVQVVHNGARSNYDVTALTHGDLSQNPTLSDGDLVFVPQGHSVDFSGIWQALGALSGFGWFLRGH